MIIDFHTHIFPDKIAAKTIGILEHNIEKQAGVHQNAVLDGTLAGLQASMRENNIDVSVVLPIATTVTQSTTINNFASQINGKNGIFSLGSIHPLQENWESELERIASLCLLGIKLHPEYQQIAIDSPEAIRVLQKCEQLGLLVVLHAGADIGMPPPVHCAPKQLAHALQSVGGSNIIAAHMGGWQMWDDVERYLVGTPIYLDTSFSIDYLPDEQFLRIIKNHTADQILHATDSPWEKQGRAAAKIKAMSLSDEEKEKILFGNAKKLLHL